MVKTELLSPAGSLEKLRFAAAYGADAVYAGAPLFSLRKNAENFTPDDFAEGLAFLHERKKKLFLAANIFFHNEDIRPFEDYLKEIAPLGFDGIILSDLGMIDLVREKYPDLEVHVSTQANTTNRASANLEAFVHGAMCISYSGRCLLSNYFSSVSSKPGDNRDANRGDCTQVCRWEFALTEKKREGEYFPIEESEYGTAILSSRDLNMAPHLSDLIKAGVTSFKIEGRMKSAWYAAVTTRVYRHALDRAEAGLGPDLQILAQLDEISHRDYTTGFYYQGGRSPDPSGNLGAQGLRNSRQEQLLLALVEEVRGNTLVAKAMNPVRNDGSVLLTKNPKFGDGELREFTLKVDGEVRDMVRPTERFELVSDELALGAMGAYSLLVKDL